MSVIGRRFTMYMLLPVAALTAIVIYRAELEAPAPASPNRILLVTGGSGAYWDRVIRGVHAAAERNGVEVVVASPRRDAALKLTRTAESDGLERPFDGVIAATEALGRAELDQSALEHAKLITIGADSLADKRRCHVGRSEYSAGRLAAVIARQELPRGGVVIVQAARNQGAVEQLRGFQDAINVMNSAETTAREPLRYQCVSSVVLVDSQQQRAAALWETARAHPKVDAIVDFSEDSAEALLAAKRGHASLSQAKLITFDQSEIALRALERGEIAAVLTFDPYQIGYQAAAFLALMMRDGELGCPLPGRGSISVFPQAVRASELVRFRADRTPNLAGPAA